MSSPALDPPPTQARFILVGWLCGLSVLLYLDRICMGQAVVPIQKELGLSNSEISDAMVAFTLAYGLCAIPVGRLSDRFGSRSVLAGLVVAWSAFTVLTGAATGLLMLLIVRFLFGAAEAGAFPNAARVISRWYAITERGRVQGVMLAFAQIGAVIAPAAAAFMIETAGWRWAFVAFGLLGFVWAVGFWLWFRDDPAQHPRVNATELAAIRVADPPPTTDPGPVPWREVCKNRGIIVLCLISTCGSFYTYFFYSWFQKYLNASRGIENVEAGNLTSLVMAGSAVGMLLGGWLADRIPRLSSDPVRARRTVGVVCYLIAAACLFVGVRCDDSLILAILWGLSFCAMHITLPNWWMVAIPQAGRHTATLCGLMNGMGVFGAMVSQKFVGVFADWQATRGLSGRAQWDPLFDVYVGVLLCGGIAWWLYRFTPLEVRPQASEDVST